MLITSPEMGKRASHLSSYLRQELTRIFGYPLEQAVAVAVDAVTAWLAENEGMERVVFCVFGADAERAYRDALDE